MQLVTVLKMGTPLALVLAATEHRVGSNSYFADTSWLILITYDILLLVYGFLQILGSLYKGNHILLTMTCRFVLFLVVCGLREAMYGDVTTDNLPVFRCFLLFAILTCSVHTFKVDAFVFFIYMFFVACDCLLSIHFCQENSFADNKLYTNNKYAFVAGRAMLTSVPFWSYILKSFASFRSFKTDCEILHVLKNNDSDAAMKLIESLKQFKVKIIIFKDEAVAKRIVYTTRKVLFLATLMQIVCVMTKYYDQRRSENIGVNSTSDEIDSLLYFFMQPYINFGSATKIVETCLTTMYSDTFNVAIKYYKVFWKIMIYMAVVVINAFVFVLVVQSLFTFIAELAEQGVRHFQDVQVHLATTERTVYSSYQNESQIFFRDYREDVAFHCSKTYEFQTDTHRVRMFWIHNDRILDSSKSDRINISVLYKDWYAESDLRIMLIDEMDFGDYKCVLVEEIDKYIPILYTYLGNGVTGSMLFERRITYRQFQEKKYELRQQIFTKNVYEIDTGSFVVFEIFAYVTLAEIDDISFQYTVNGIDISEICFYDWLSCYPFALIQKNFGHTKSSRLSWGLDYSGLFIIYVRFCACSKIFGIHKLVLFRDYFNKTSRRTESIEIEHPVTFYFLPRDNDTGIRQELFINNTKEFINRYLENNDQISIPIPFGRKLRISVYSFFNFCTVILWLAFIYGVLRTVESIVFFYCYLTIIPARNLLLFGTIRPVFPSIERGTFAGITCWEEKLYDVFISYSENDCQFAQNVILPYVEGRCCKEACFPHRDLAHETGNTLHIYTKATQLSRKFIVILSSSYINDPDCNGLQLLTCIHPLITERSSSEKDLLIIKIEKKIELPVQIRLDSRIQIFDWTKTNDIHDNLRKIKDWLVGYS